MRWSMRAVATAWVLLGGCARPTKAPIEPAEAPSSVSQGVASSTARVPEASAVPASSAGAPAGTATASATPSAAPPAPPPVSTPALHDAHGKPLPQTEDRPIATSPAFLQRMQLLVRAIEVDDAKLAHDAFFPAVAYEQVKDIAKPAVDHERRLLAAFARNVHEYHRQLGKDASGLRFVRVEVPEDKVKWMKLGSEGNRVGYFRVLRSRLVVATGSDKERSFELTSMISWRGEWYVVHLHGFK